MMKMSLKLLVVISVIQLAYGAASEFKRKATFISKDKEQGVESSAVKRPTMLQFHRCLASETCSNVLVKDSQNSMQQWKKVPEIVLPQVTTEFDRCTSGYRFDGNITCYKNSTSLTMLDEAKSTCTVEGGKLVILLRSTVNAFIASFLQSDSWIGLRKHGGTFKWHDGQVAKFQNWENEDSKGGGNCVVMLASNGKWETRSCSEKNTFICEHAALN